MFNEILKYKGTIPPAEEQTVFSARHFSLVVGKAAKIVNDIFNEETRLVRKRPKKGMQIEFDESLTEELKEKTASELIRAQWTLDLLEILVKRLVEKNQGRDFFHFFDENYIASIEKTIKEARENLYVSFDPADPFYPTMSRFSEQMILEIRNTENALLDIIRTTPLMRNLAREVKQLVNFLKIPFRFFYDYVEAGEYEEDVHDLIEKALWFFCRTRSDGEFDHETEEAWDDLLFALHHAKNIAPLTTMKRKALLSILLERQKQQDKLRHVAQEFEEVLFKNNRSK